MRRIVTLILAPALLGCTPLITKAQESAVTARRVLARVTPVYPDLARKLQLSGAVKLGVTVAPNGTVKKTSVLGGSPLLAQSAQQAVEKWRWEPTSNESQELIEINFHPH